MKVTRIVFFGLFSIITCLAVAMNADAQPTHFWPMDVGNYWVYNNGAWRNQITEIDMFTIPGVATYVWKGYANGLYDISRWYSVDSTGFREWKRVYWDSSLNAWVTGTVNAGLLNGKYPIIVGDTYTTTSTGISSAMGQSCPINASMTVTVESQEMVTVPVGTFRAYKGLQTEQVWSYECGINQVNTERLWFVPYLGVVKIQDSYSTSNLTSMSVQRSGRFIDVPSTYFAYNHVEAVAAAGITGGCTPGPPPQFCPDDFITRGQMAVFLVTSLGQSPLSCSGRFADVPIGHPFCGFVERLAATGITGGCGGGNFCPNDPVTRGQMAVFIEAALGRSPNACSGRFNDVSVSNGFCGFIERLADDGITGGCGPGVFCPNDPVTRGQMAVFLVAAPSPLNP